MYTDLSKLKETDISIPKGSKFLLLKDGRIGIYTYELLNIYNMTTFKVDLTIDYKTFGKDENDYSTWGELVCLTELNNGYLVLGFGRAMDFTNLIIDIKDNKPKLIHKFVINNGDYCCRKVISFQIGEKEYILAGDYQPQIFNATEPFNEITTLDIDLMKMIQIKDSNLLAYVSDNNFSILDLTDIEKNKKGKEIISILFDIGTWYFELLQYNKEIIALGKNIIQFINLENYNHTSIELNKEFYNIYNYNAMCILFNGQLLTWSSNGELLKIDINKKEIIQIYEIKPKATVYYYNCLAYEDKYILFAEEEKLYEINYNEKEEIKNYEEKKLKKSVEDFMKEQDNIVKKIIEEKDLKEEDDSRNVFGRPPDTFYDLYRHKSLKKEFPFYKENEISYLSMKEFKYLKEENKKFFNDLAVKDHYIPFQSHK